jgi:tetratricopeptide (TPR) repeat protein
MNIWAQVLAAIGAELASIALLNRSTSDLRLAVYFGLHGLASGLAAAVAWQLLPPKFKGGRNLWGIGLVFCMAFFAPAVGVIALLLVVHVASRFPKAVNTDRYVEIDTPQYVANEKDQAANSDLRAGYARRILASTEESVDTKLRVLLAVQDMRPKVAIPMLQGLLGDPAEDIRLLAYSMMDAWEKDITRRLQSAQTQLDALPVSKETGDHGNKRALNFNAHRRLAELYWEQVDTKLARGDLRQFALQNAKRHCESALEIQPSAAGVWLLFGEVLSELQMGEVASRALRAARAAGADSVKVNQLSARLAFERGEYDKVREHMNRVNKSARVPYSLKQVSRFWAGQAVDLPL